MHVETYLDTRQLDYGAIESSDGEWEVSHGRYCLNMARTHASVWKVSGVRSILALPYKDEYEAHVTRVYHPKRGYCCMTVEDHMGRRLYMRGIESTVIALMSMTDDLAHWALIADDGYVVATALEWLMCRGMMRWPRHALLSAETAYNEEDIREITRVESVVSRIVWEKPDPYAAKIIQMRSMGYEVNKRAAEKWMSAFYRHIRKFRSVYYPHSPTPVMDQLQADMADEWMAGISPQPRVPPVMKQSVVHVLTAMLKRLLVAPRPPDGRLDEYVRTSGDEDWVKSIWREADGHASWAQLLDLGDRRQ